MFGKGGERLRHDHVTQMSRNYLPVLKQRNLVGLLDTLAISYSVHFLEYTIKNMNRLINQYKSDKAGIYNEVADDVQSLVIFSLAQVKRSIDENTQIVPCYSHDETQMIRLSTNHFIKEYMNQNQFANLRQFFSQYNTYILNVFYEY